MSTKTAANHPDLTLPQHAVVIGLVAMASTLVHGGVNGFWQGCSSYGVSVIFTTILWFGNVGIIHAARRRLPGVDNSVRRVVLQIVLGTAFSALTASLLESVITYAQHGHLPPSAQIVRSIKTSLTMAYIVAAIWEASYYFNLWREANAEAAALRQAGLEAQLSRLKTELNPHFLFNNLNTLITVIEEDQARAVRMVQALSDYYRYILRAQTTPISTLAEELESLYAYAALLRIRYEDGFQLHVDVPEHCQQLQVPTLILQMLAENAAKHNAATNATPLYVELSVDEDCRLTMRNNIIPRHQPSTGAHLGLANLKERCTLLGIPDFAAGFNEAKTTFHAHFTIVNQPVKIFVEKYETAL